MTDRIPEAEADAGGEPLDAQTLESLDRGLADIATGRVTPLEEFERDQPS